LETVTWYVGREEVVEPILVKFTLFLLLKIIQDQEKCLLYIIIRIMGWA